MKNINIYVKQFKKENKIVFPTWRKLVHIAKKNDWKLKPFSKAKKLIKEHELDDYVKKHRAFAYEYAGEIIILYRDNLKGYNRLYTISHEIGHIYLGHTLKEIDKIEEEETEADEFAQLLLSGYKKSLAASSILLLTLIATVYFLNLPNNAPEDNIKETSTAIMEATMKLTTEVATEVVTDTSTKPSIESTEVTIESLTKPLTEETTITISEESLSNDNEYLYYVTAGGQKYHLKSCYQINPDRCIPLTLDQVKNMGYAPCKTCRPNE